MTDARYDALLARARQIYPGLDVGRPARSRGYWVVVSGMRLMRLGIRLDVDGTQHVAPGAAIMVANHLSTLDPVVGLMSTWWRAAAFTKAEWFEGRSAFFFRAMGQIPLRRGDDDSTQWALEMAQLALDDGTKVGIYPEGTRGPSPTSLYRLHQRLLIPLIQGHPDVPVHAVATTYPPGGWWRRRARVRMSAPLPIDARTMTGDEITAIVRDALVELGGLSYVNTYAFVAKARAARAAGAVPDIQG